MLASQRVLLSHCSGSATKWLPGFVAAGAKSTELTSSLKGFLLKSFPIMASPADLERVKARAEKTEKFLVDLRAKVDLIRKAAVKRACQPEEEKMIKANEELRKEVNTLRQALIIAEIGNGVRQVRMPSRSSLAAFSTSAAASAPVVNGDASPKEKDVSTSAKDKPVKGDGQGGKKTKQAPAEGQPPEAGGGKKAKKEKGGKGEAGEATPKKAGGAAAADNADAPVDISRLDMRVGKIVGVDKHPDADSLYVEQVDLGEGRNRTIVSGLVKHVPLNAMKDRVAVFMCNLKPAKMRGVLSEGMIMCASSPEKVEILVPPTDSVIGDRVYVEEFPGTPDAQLNPKKKIWETLKPDVRTNSDRVASYKGKSFVIKDKGVVVAPTLSDTQIS